MIEYRFRVPSAAVFTLYSYSKALKYPLEYPTAGSLTSLYVSPCFLSLLGFISSLPQLAWDKRLCCCCYALSGCGSAIKQENCREIVICFSLTFFLVKSMHPTNLVHYTQFFPQTSRRTAHHYIKKYTINNS
jgi:hypothetical protein